MKNAFKPRRVENEGIHAPPETVRQPGLILLLAEQRDVAPASP
jgi:hypothetical protein